MTQAPPPGPPPATPIKLTDEIKLAVNGAFDNRTPVVICYVDKVGQPSLSLRGTTQALSDTQLAVWARNPEGGLPNEIAVRPRVTLWYRDPATRTNLQFRGRAHVASDPAIRDRIYDSSPEPERNFDPERKGVAIVIDLDRVDGRTPEGPIRMERGA
jgi:hypothetical protein